MSKSDNEAARDEEWVFNTRISNIENCKQLVDVEYRLGKQAYDIHGEKIHKSYMLPVFVKKSSLGKLDANWKKEMEFYRRD